jgi:argininosuccinate synthase
MMQRIVLAYSGGFEASVAIPWLAEMYGAEIVAVIVDLGQGKELEDVRDRALALGATRAHVLDVREEFARDYVLPALKADALHQDKYRMGAELGRLLIARKLVDIAAIEQADVIAHGCTGSGRGPLEVAARALNPALKVLAPVRDWGMTRSEAIGYARAHDVAVPVTEGPVSLARSPAECPDQTASVELTFDRGVPTAINGVAMAFVELVASLGTIAGAHDVAALVLQTAHGELQRLVTSGDTDRFSRIVSLQYADVVRHGLWFTPLREALDAYVEKIQERVTGLIRLELFKGGCRVVDRRSPFALDDLSAVTYDAAGSLDQPRSAITT